MSQLINPKYIVMKKNLTAVLALTFLCILSRGYGQWPRYVIDDENITEAIASDPMRKALVQVQGIFGELDKSMLVKKLRKAREKIRQEKGRCEGVRPYGHLEGEAEILKHIKRLRRKPKNSCRKRRTYQSIADHLNNKRIKPRRGEEWTSSLVYNVLKANNGGKKQ